VRLTALEKARTSPVTLVGWGLWAALVLLLIPHIFTFVELGLARIAWPWQIDFVEGINLNTALQFAQGRNIYRHNGPDSFLSAPYPPLYYAITGPATWFAGTSLAPGRIVSFVATIIIAALTAYIVWKIAGKWAAGAVAGMLWLSVAPVVVWSAFYKQDLPALAFGMAGVAWALTYPKGRRIYIAALLFAMAFYVKQSSVSPAAATTLWLLLRDPRSGLRFMLALGGMVVAPFLALNLLLKGGLLEHLVGNHALGFSDRRFMRTLRRLLGEYWPLVTLGGLAMAAGVGSLFIRGESSLLARARARLATPWSLPIFYSVIGGTVMLIEIGYEGANYNHLIDLLLPLCIIAGTSLAWAWRRVETWRVGNSPLPLGTMAVVGAVWLLQVFALTDPKSWYAGGWPTPLRNAEMQGLARLVAGTEGDIYSEDNHLLVSNGHMVLYDDASTFVPLASLKEWDDSVFNQRVRDRHFALVLLSRGSVRWTPEGLSAFTDNYTLKFPGSLDTYEPKLYPDTPQYSRDCTVARSSEAIDLQGYSVAPGVASYGVKQGEVLRAVLYWQAQRKPTQSYASYLHLLNEAGERITGRDNPQTGALQPTTEWEPAKVMTDTTAIPLPADIPPGRYRLLAGMYRVEADSIVGLSATCLKGDTYGDAVSLGWVEVK
jgi:hypothetical protein